MENLKCESYFGDYKCHVKTNVKRADGKFIFVDKCLKEAVENLNNMGFKTAASCCGHGIINPIISIDGLNDRLPIVHKSEVFYKYGKPLTSGRELWDFITDNYNFIPKT